ncbi:MAG: hypothetical protein LBR06_10385 [Bacteroidales bacterium]|nr:hypothetical protein [Bacteroidales bacterium]
MLLLGAQLCSSCGQERVSVSPVAPPAAITTEPFGAKDEGAFRNPPLMYHPETWFHFIGGNVSKQGITADIEAIAAAGISGIQLFHGQFGGAWPGVEPQITCLSPSWDEHVRFVGEECRRLGLRFTMQNCPGWAMSGGPWIKPENAMRTLVYSRTDVSGRDVRRNLPRPQPSNEDWRDYRDVAVLAFPTPADDTGEPLKPQSVKCSDVDFKWKEFLSGDSNAGIKLYPALPDMPHILDIRFTKPAMIRTVEFSSINGYNHGWCYEPGIKISLSAVLSDGKTVEVLNTDMPPASWQDSRPISLACNEVKEVSHYRLAIDNQHDMNLSSLRLYSAARKNNWESEAGWTLRGHVRASDSPTQSSDAFVNPEQVIDVSQFVDENGDVVWQKPEGRWTILRIGHVNAGQRNAPAPKEATGWECDKLSEEGPNAHFAGYIGRLVDGPLNGGLLNGVLLDSWECNTQTWTTGMDDIFAGHTGYELRKWMPALFGYVMSNHEISSRFLLDWRRTVGDLFANRFFGQMAKLAGEKGLDIQYETAAGDIFPADILEYYKHAAVPMAEFWQPVAENYVGSLNFKPVKPTVSAARMYGKVRVAAEAFTSFSLTWDEHWEMLKEVANINCVEGITHLIFHTYTHNPRIDWRPPGTSFGSNIGTPFLRGQTWWKYMPEFTTYLARLNYMLERGRPVSDILWYLGDEISHKPDQKTEFDGYKYDYCNTDALLTRISVKDGRLVTPDGLSYSMLWLPDNQRMLPATLEKLVALADAGAVISGNAPESPATLSGSADTRRRFDAAVKNLWGNNRILALPVKDVLARLNIEPDVIGGNVLWLHRQTHDADWYYIAAPFNADFSGNISFRNSNYAELWDPVSGRIAPAKIAAKDGNRTVLNLHLPRAGSCFVVFRKSNKINDISKDVSCQHIQLASEWTLSFPEGWGAPATLVTDRLKAWKELDISAEGKAFSGTVTYNTVFNFDTKPEPAAKYFLDLGKVDFIADVTLNGENTGILWTPPYKLDITNVLKKGTNELNVKVTGTWFNRLVYDANLAEEQRKTWTIAPPSKDSPLRESGLLGPVNIVIEKLYKTDDN